MLSIKITAKLEGMSPQTVLGIVVATGVYASLGYDCIVTSVNDGRHMDGSLHYVGDAFDLRTRHVESDCLKELITERLKAALGSGYDVVLEGDHIHVEYDPK